MDLVRPRYEFRSFQDDLSLIEEQIFARGSRESFDHPESDDLQDTCDDIYFVRPRSTGWSLKIRNDRLELKALLIHEGDLEIWSSGSQLFPCHSPFPGSSSAMEFCPICRFRKWPTDSTGPHC